MEYIYKILKGICKHERSEIDHILIILRNPKNNIQFVDEKEIETKYNMVKNTFM